MTTRPLPLLLSLALFAACHAKTADPGHGPMSSTGLPIPDGGPLPDGALAPDGGGGGGPDAAANETGKTDAGADRPPSPEESAYKKYLDDRWKAWSERWAACFNTAPEALSPGRSPLYDDTPDQHAYSLAHGLVALDAAKAQACLDALRTLPCKGLVTESYRATCNQALVGKVAGNGFCVTPEDCQSPADSCQMKEMHGCYSRCSPAPARAAVDEPCADRPCAAGAFCATPVAPATDARCRPVVAEGAACQDTFACAAGTWCQPATAGEDPGTCRKVQAGLACQGSWQCPFAYACLIPSGATAGTCQPGHKKGEACSFHGKELPGGPYHDCANALFCYPDAANHYTCGAGHELGESCADLDVGAMTPLSVPCRVGSCRPGSTGKPTCLLDQKAGEACTSDLPCELGLVCANGKCADPTVRLGERCTSDGTFACPDGARCAFQVANAGQGTCVVVKHVGDKCGDPDDCEAGASCAGGVCTACK